MNNSNMCNLLSSPNSLQCISNTNIYILPTYTYSKNWSFPQLCARRAQGNPPNYIHPPSVGMIYSILTYIFNCNIDMACYIQYKDIFQLTHNPKMFKSSKCSKIFHNFSCQNSHILISQLKWVFLHVQISQEHVQISQEQEIQVQISQGQIFQGQIFPRSKIPVQIFPRSKIPGKICLSNSVQGQIWSRCTTGNPSYHTSAP